MSDENVRAGAELVRELIEQGRSPSEIAAQLSAGLGILFREVGDTDQTLLAAFAHIEHHAGCKSNASLALQMPCPSCWSTTIAEIEQRAHHGTALNLCLHRRLAFELACTHGEVTAWQIKPATQAELDEHKRQTTRAQFHERGLKSIH